MRVLLTDDRGTIGAALARALAATHDLRLLPDPRDRAAVAAALEGCDAAVQVVPPLPSTGDERTALAALDRATRGTYNLLTADAPALRRMVLVTSLRPFARYPANWAVDETWMPRPTADVADLAPYLAEVAAREVVRVRPTEVVVLRLGEVVGADAVAHGEPDPRWLHVDDAVHAVERALALPVSPDGTPGVRWRAFHVVDGGAGTRFPLALDATETLGYAPRHRLTDALPTPPAEADESAFASAAAGSPRIGGGGGHPRTIRNVVLFGAGGPLGAVAAAAMARDHRLRLTDLRPLADIAAGPPQSPGAPLPRPLEPPHEERRVDVTDPDQVAAAVAGMDAILNLTVMRHDPVEAFRVNLLGALNVMQAAVAHGVRRVVQTGPIQMINPHPAGYGANFGIVPDAPSRPGDDLYFVSKLLGQEVVRIFAEEHALDVPCLLFGNFVEPSQPPEPGARFYSFTLGWADTGEVLRRAVMAPPLPRPFEVLHPNADLPHGRYPNDKAKRLLGWQPRDRLEAWWQRGGGDDRVGAAVGVPPGEERAGPGQ